MSEISLKVEQRENIGKGPARRLRAIGSIPAILYGKGKTSYLSVNPSVLKKALLQGGGINTLLNLEISGGKSTSNHTAIVKEIQKDPVFKKYTHVDFYELDLKKKVVVKVALHFTGKAEGQKQGGIVQPIIREITVKCLPHKIPKFIEVDVTPLNVGDTLHMNNLKSSDEVEILFEKNEAIVTVAIPKEEAAPVPAAEAAPVEGAAAVPLEGAPLKEGETPKKEAESKKAEPKKAEAKKEEK